jgi:hypothetical protein
VSQSEAERSDLMCYYATITLHQQVWGEVVRLQEEVDWVEDTDQAADVLQGNAMQAGF